MFPTKANIFHVNQHGHSVSNVRIKIAEKIKTRDVSYTKLQNVKTDATSVSGVNILVDQISNMNLSPWSQKWQSN